MMVEGLVEGYVIIIYVIIIYVIIIIIMIAVPWSDVRGHECSI